MKKPGKIQKDMIEGLGYKLLFTEFPIPKQSNRYLCLEVLNHLLGNAPEPKGVLTSSAEWGLKVAEALKAKKEALIKKEQHAKDPSVPTPV